MAESAHLLARSAAARIHEAGERVFLAGGCVRDHLLEVPVKDYDLATSATPTRLKQLFPHALEVGAHFGVVIVREGEAEIQIATFRSDHAYRDGRRPEGVTFESDPRQDVLRPKRPANPLRRSANVPSRGNRRLRLGRPPLQLF